MTFQEMQTYVTQRLDRADAPYFTVGEMDIYLNDAQEEFVKTRYRAFEQNEKLSEDLLPLVRRAVYLNVLGGVFYQDYIDLTLIDGFQYILRLSGNWVITPCAGEPVTKSRTIRRVEQDDIDRVMENAFHKPDDNYPVYVLEARASDAKRAARIYAASYADDVSMTFLSTPTTINTVSTPAGTPTLPANTHREICKIAIRMILADIEHPRYQTHINEINNEQ